MRLNETLPAGLGLGTNDGKQYLYSSGTTFILPEPCNGIVFQQVRDTNTWTTTPEELGYLWGPGRKWVTPRVSSFMRTLQTQLRVSAKLLNDPALVAIDGSWQTHRVENPEDAYKDLLAIMGDWKPGQSVDPDLYPDLLDHPRTGQWQDRLRRWSVLRWEPKGPGLLSWSGLRVLDFKEHTKTLESLDEIRRNA